MDWPFGDIRPLSMGVILADPAWQFALRSTKGETKAPQAHYRCLPLPQIKALPVGQLAAPDCLLWMWATWPMLPQALEVMAAWGFRYVTGGAWAKRSSTGKKWAFGTGYVLRSASEPFLLGAIGAPAYGPEAARVRGLIEAPVREHSRKPEDQYTMLDRLVPDVPRVELFARQRRAGWAAWGDQADLFEPAD